MLSRNYDCIVRLEFYILLRVLPLHNLAVIKGQAGGFTACVLPENVDRFFLSEIPETTGKSYGV